MPIYIFSKGWNAIGAGSCGSWGGSIYDDMIWISSRCCTFPFWSKSPCKYWQVNLRSPVWSPSILHCAGTCLNSSKVDQQNPCNAFAFDNSTYGWDFHWGGAGGKTNLNFLPKNLLWRCTLLSLANLEERGVEDTTWPELTMAATTLVGYRACFEDLGSINCYFEKIPVVPISKF